MALVTFEDLPSTNTPLNATNLNNNFEELDNKIPIVLNASGSGADSVYNVDFINGLIPNFMPTAIPNSDIPVVYSGASLSNNHSFTLGSTSNHAVFLNLKFAGVNLTSSDGNVTLATLSSYFRPSTETAILAQVNDNVLVYGWLRTSGDIVLKTSGNLVDADVRIVTMYI